MNGVPHERALAAAAHARTRYPSAEVSTTPVRGGHGVLIRFPPEDLPFPITGHLDGFPDVTLVVGRLRHFEQHWVLLIDGQPATVAA